MLGWSEMDWRMKEEFAGVVKMVTLSPLRERALEKSSRGMVWPWAMKGKMTTCGRPLGGGAM